MSNDSQPRSRRAQQRNLSAALTTIQEVADALSIPQPTVETATAIYRRLLSEVEPDRVQGNGIERTAVASVYVACKVNRVPRNADEFVEATGVSRKGLLRRSKDITSKLALDLEGFTDARQYVERYCEELGIPEHIESRACQILEYCDDAGVAGGKDPSGWAAAAIYNAGIDVDARIKQAELAEKADVTQVTVRNRYQEQREVILATEDIPDTAEDVVAWYCDRLALDDGISDRTLDILDCGAEQDLPIADAPRSYAAAALRKASQDADDEIGMKALKTPIGVDSSEIHSRVCELKNALRECDSHFLTAFDV